MYSAEPTEVVVLFAGHIVPLFLEGFVAASPNMGLSQCDSPFVYGLKCNVGTLFL